MAATDTLTREYRRQSLALRSVTLRDLQRLWPALDWDDIDSTFPTWLTGVGALVTRDRRLAAGLATWYLSEHRRAAGVPGAPDVRLAPQIEPRRLETAMRVTTVVAVKRATLAGQTAEQAMKNAFVQSSGSATRLVLDAGRETIRRTTLADARTRGWRRVGAPRCDFCRMLIGRGAVYTEATSDFAAHDHCGCSAEPVYL